MQRVSAAVRKRSKTGAPPDFDHAKVKADAEGYKLPAAYESIDVEAIRERI